MVIADKLAIKPIIAKKPVCKLTLENSSIEEKQIPIQYSLFDYSLYGSINGSIHYRNSIKSPFKRRKCHLKKNPKLWGLNSNKRTAILLHIDKIDYSRLFMDNKRRK